MIAKILVAAGAVTLATSAPAVATTSCALAIENTQTGAGQRCEYAAEGFVGTLSLTVTAGAAAVSVDCSTGGATLTGAATSSHSTPFRRTGQCGVILVSLVDGTSATATAN